MSAGALLEEAMERMVVLAVIMNMAAGMPFPETSAIRKAMWSLSRKKKS